MTETTGAQVAEPTEAVKPEVTVEELQGRITELESSLASAVAEAKGHQKKAQKSTAESIRLQKLESTIDNLNSKLDLNQAMLADVVDRVGNEDDTPRKRRSDEFLSQAVKPDPAKSPVTPETAQRYERQVSKLGLQRTDEEYWNIFDAVMAGDFMGADDIIDEVKAKQTEAKKAPEPKAEVEKKARAIVEEGKRKEAEEKGQLEIETGGPSAGGVVYTTKEINDMDLATYRKAFPRGYSDILDGVKSGKIRE